MYISKHINKKKKKKNSVDEKGSSDFPRNF